MNNNDSWEYISDSDSGTEADASGADAIGADTSGEDANGEDASSDYDSETDDLPWLAYEPPLDSADDETGENNNKKRRLNSKKDSEPKKFTCIFTKPIRKTKTKINYKIESDSYNELKTDSETDSEPEPESERENESDSDKEENEEIKSILNTLIERKCKQKTNEEIRININKINLKIEELRKILGTFKDTELESTEEVIKLKNELLKAENSIKLKNNPKLFKRLLKQQNVRNDISFFKTLSLIDQERILKELQLIKEDIHIDKPYRLQLIESNMPTEFKSLGYKQIAKIEEMTPVNSEYYKLKQWIDMFMRLPFGKYKNLPVTLETDGREKCYDFIDNSKKILDTAVYGLNDVKMQIMQLVGQWITNPKAMGTAIAIKGPMGTGKTTLVKDGISKILGRDFEFIALGGAQDGSYLEGHSYAYEGSSWGKIVEVLVKSKSMNPVIFFDELDKVSSTEKGNEIIGILTHLTDTTQNSKFQDKYFTGLELDLSKVLFIFSYNDESKINKILLDRMYKVEINGYSTSEKIVIANQYLIPKVLQQVNMNVNDVVIPRDILKKIIIEFTNKERGVRDLKRCIEIIYTKINLYRLIRPGSTMFGSELEILNCMDNTKPVIITEELLDKMLKKNSKGDESWRRMFS